LIEGIAGPKGAGETTFFKSMFSDKGPEFINANEIAARLCMEDVESVAVKAGRLMWATIADRIAAGRASQSRRP